jgi:hypothetical protein
VPEVPEVPEVPDLAVHVLDAVLVDEAGQALPNRPFEVDFGVGAPIPGQTDENGVIHLDKCPSDQCTLRFLKTA